MITSNEHPQLQQILIARREKIAQVWIQSIRTTSYLPQRQEMLQTFFEGLVSDCITAMFAARSVEREATASAAGVRLAKLRYLHPEALGASQKVLGNTLLGGLPPEYASAFAPRIFDVISGFSVGFVRETRHEMLVLQERLHQSVRETLLASEEKFQRLTEIVSAAIFIFQGIRLRYVNNWLIQKTGYTRDELFRMNVWDIFHPAHQKMVMEYGQARLRGETVPAGYEVRLQCKDGQLMWVEVSFAPIEFESDDAVLGTAFDITERKQAAERNAMLLSRVQEADRRQRALLSAIPDMVFRCDKNGLIIDYHTNYPETLFVPPEQFLNQTVVAVLPPPAGEKLQKIVSEVLQTEGTYETEYQLEVDNVPFFFSAHFVHSGDEVLIAIRDITSRKRAEIRAMRTERMAALGNLAASLAHELNNPLQAIQTNIDMILDFPISPEEKDENFRAIRQELARVTELSQHILNFANPHPFTRAEVMLEDVVNQVLRLWRKKFEAGKITIHTDFSKIPPVIASKDQLHQVLLNILLNAVDAIHSEADSGTVVISIGANSVEKQAWIKIINDGPHIPPDDIDHLFEPFFSTKPNGNGLGLWTSYNIIQQYNGSLYVENFRGGCGVIFTIALPLTNNTGE